MYGAKLKPLALTCYRLATKFNQNQPDFWKDGGNNEPDAISRCSNQVIYDKLSMVLLETGLVDRPVHRADI